MNSKQLELFYETAKYPSFNIAAENLYISQSSLSHSIRLLEDELGYPLFVRSKNGIQLTKAGERVHSDCGQLLSMLDTWKHYGNAPAKEMLHIYGSGVLADWIFPQIALKCKDEHRDTQLSFSSDSASQLICESADAFSDFTFAFAFFYVSEQKNVLRRAAENKWEAIVQKTGSTYLMANRKSPLASLSEIDLTQLPADHYVATHIADNFFHENLSQLYEEVFDETQMVHLHSRAASLDMVNQNENIVTLCSFMYEAPFALDSYPDIVLIPVTGHCKTHSLITFYNHMGNHDAYKQILRLIRTYL
jgi:DNA-binding transcriptional LysR family regulator